MSTTTIPCDNNCGVDISIKVAWMSLCKYQNARKRLCSDCQDVEDEKLSIARKKYALRHYKPL